MINRNDVEQYEDDIDWVNAEVDDVYIDGIPLDGHYLEHLINTIDF